jgi:hypothetical protein
MPTFPDHAGDKTTSGKEDSPSRKEWLKKAGEEASSGAGAQKFGEDKPANVRRWWSRINFPAAIALIAAVAATASAVYAYSQVQVARQQNTTAEQQQLLSLVIAIEQEPALLSQATLHLTGGQLINASVQYENEVVADGEAGAQLIRSLNGQGVSSIEYTQIALALEDSADNTVALAYFARASSIAGDPDSLASALRDEAILRYQLGGSENNQKAHQEMQRSVQAYSVADITKKEFEQNAALSYLQDAEYQMPAKGCDIARTDLNNAATEIRLAGSSLATVTRQRYINLLANDLDELKKYC